MKLSRYLPFLEWGREYRRETFVSDLMAAVIVTIMLIPQSLAYAMLAGMPPETGLYASMAPLVLYAIFGTGRTLAVGPVAVISLMTAVAVGRVADEGSMGYVTAALTLAVLSGVILVAMGLFRLGFVANFLSHPVISGFITAAGRRPARPAFPGLGEKRRTGPALAARPAEILCQPDRARCAAAGGRRLHRGGEAV